jgi:nitrate/nitrite transport system ATP-binding protein
MITNSVEEAILLSDRIVPIVPGPPATLGMPIPVELTRPRSLAQLAHDEQATQVRAHVVSTLTASVRARSLPGTSHATTSAASLGAVASAKAALVKPAGPFDSPRSLRAEEIR